MQKLIRVFSLALACMIFSGFTAGPAQAKPNDECAVFGTNCPTSRPKPPRQTQPPKPDPVPVLSRCDRLHAAANTISELESFAQACQRDRRRRTALDRAAALRQDAARACDRRFDAAAASKSQPDLQTYLQRCPGNYFNASARLMLEQLAVEGSLSRELTRWGLTYRQWCGLPFNELVRRTGISARKPEASAAMQGGDRVARTLLGYLSYQDYLGTGVGYETYFNNMKASADAGDPRAMNALASDLLARVQPNTSAADFYIARASSQKCAIAIWFKANRLIPGAYPDIPAPAWSNEKIADLLAQAASLGSGGASCTQISQSYNAQTRAYTMPPLERERLWRNAVADGSSCGEHGLIMESSTNWRGTSGANIGLCPVNDTLCIRTKLTDLVNRTDPSYGQELIKVLTDPAFGGTGGWTSELLAIAIRAAQAGDDYAVSTVGIAYLIGGKSLVPNLPLSNTWCSRGYNRGQAIGGICLGFLSYTPQLARPFFDMANRKQPCASFNYSGIFFPDYTTLDSLVVRLRALPAAEKNRLLSKLLLMREATSAALATNVASCKAGAQNWLIQLDGSIKAALTT